MCEVGMRQGPCSGPWGGGVERNGEPVLGECIIKASKCAQIRGIAQMRFHQARIQLHSTPEFLPRAWPIPLVEKLEGPQGSMGFGEGFVQLYGLHRRSLCLGH